MTERRFDVTGPFEMDGLMFRIVMGEKRQHGTDELGHDRCVQWYSHELQRWIPISMRTVGFLADFLFENETYLYPPSHGFAGGGKFKTFLWHSMKHGWQKAWAGVETEKRNKRGLFDGEAA